MRPSLIGLIVLSVVYSETGSNNATITVVPEVAVALFNDTTFLNCSTTSVGVEWLFGSDQYKEPFIYSYGNVKPTYVDRFRVENYTNSLGNHWSLIFLNVTKNDAGLYICRDPDNPGQEGKVHLTVLETQPVCDSNVSVDRLIKQNCSIKPDTVQLSCSVRYIGKQVPELQWTKIGENMTINSSICSDSGNVYTCNLTMETELQMEGDSYYCQTTHSRTNQYNCTSDVFEIIYVLNEQTELTTTVDDKINCSANSSSKLCTFSWIFNNGTTNWTESHGPVIEFKRPGRFICQRNCIIKNYNCTFAVKTVSDRPADPQDNDNTTPENIVGIVVGGFLYGLAVIGITVGLIVFLIIFVVCLQHRPDKPVEEQPLMPSGNNIIRTITSTTDTNSEKRVRGLTILNDELFVAFEISAVIDIFNIDLSESTRSATVQDLKDPGAIAACAKNNCLYIVDQKRNTSRKEIFRVDRHGAMLCAWATDDDDKGRISINRDGNVVMTVYDKHKLKIYSPDGILMNERTIDFSDIPTPDPIDFIFHAINLDDGSFILAHGIYKSNVHRVCKVDATGNLLLPYFGSEKGSDNAHLSSPAYVAKRNDGSILVADQDNDRIILLNSDLTINTVLFTEKDGVSLPEAMYIHENNDPNEPARLFLGCNKTKISGGYVLVLKLG